MFVQRASTTDPTIWQHSSASELWFAYAARVRLYRPCAPSRREM